MTINCMYMYPSVCISYCRMRLAWKLLRFSRLGHNRVYRKKSRATTNHSLFYKRVDLTSETLRIFFGNQTFFFFFFFFLFFFFFFFCKSHKPPVFGTEIFFLSFFLQALGWSSGKYLSLSFDV